MSPSHYIVFALYLLSTDNAETLARTAQKAPENCESLIRNIAETPPQRGSFFAPMTLFPELKAAMNSR